MASLAARLDAAIRAANVPIVGVSVGDPANRATWRVHPSSLQAQAQPVIDAFDPNDPALVGAEKDADAARLSDDLALRALVRVTWEEIQKCQPRNGQTLLDLAGFRDRVKAVLRNLLT
jgi:hypothetical protein